MRMVLFTDSYTPQVNGVARTLARLVEHAGERGHEVALVSPRVAGAALTDADMHLALPSIPFPWYPELRLALPLDPWSARRLDAFAPDLVHVATEATVGWSGLGWAEKRGVPLVTSFHTDIPSYLAGYGLGGLEPHAWNYLRSFHRRARMSFCPSLTTVAQLRDAGFDHDLRVWGRGVDPDLFNPRRRREQVRERLAPGARHVLLYVGRLAPEKRVDLLIDAFNGLRGFFGEDVALVIVGDGPSGPALRQAGGPGVHFAGYLTGETLADAYAAADLFTFPSDTETFGNVVLEAMASGLPLVAAARGGVVDLVGNENRGLLFPPGDVSALGATIVHLLLEPQLRRRLALHARAEALRRSWTAVFDDRFAAYAEATGKAATRVA